MADELATDSLKLEKRIQQFKRENDAIPMTYKGEELATLYYGNSDVLNKLKYYIRLERNFKV